MSDNKLNNDLQSCDINFDTLENNNVNLVNSSLTNINKTTNFSNKKINILGIILIVLGIIMIFSFFVFNLLNDSSDVVNSNNNIENLNPGDESSDNSETGDIVSEDDIGEPELVFDAIKLEFNELPANVVVEDTELVIDYYQDSDVSEGYLKLNDVVTEIKVFDSSCTINSLYVLGDIVIIDTNCDNMKSSKISFVSFDGKLIKEFTSINDKLKYTIGSFYSENVPFSIDANKIMISYTSLTSKFIILDENGNTCSLKSINGFSECSYEENLVVEYTISYEYLGSGKFSESTLINKLYYGELLDNLR